MTRASLPNAREFAMVMRRGANPNVIVIGLTAFVTLVDLFATQAILPELAAHHAVSPAAMGVAVNASTIGMAIAGLLVALFGKRINRRLTIIASLALLAVPTALLAHAPNLATFFALRVAQGLLMATAFSLTLAHLGERCTASASPSAFAAYVTGNVASNLIGRMIAASTTNQAGLEANFYLFAALNLAGAVLVFTTLSRSAPLAHLQLPKSNALRTLVALAREAALQRTLAIGFLILFAFLGVFSFAGFALSMAPLHFTQQERTWIYLLFAPSVLTTPLAGPVAQRIGGRGALLVGFAIAIAGTAMIATPMRLLVLVGLALVAIGTFFAQAAATGTVNQVVTGDRSAASGLYLASYFSGGLAGSVVLGAAFEAWGWLGCVAGAALALIAAFFLSLRLHQQPDAST